LKERDVQDYHKILATAKEDRISSIMTQTDKFLRKLGAKVIE